MPIDPNIERERREQRDTLSAEFEQEVAKFENDIVAPELEKVIMSLNPSDRWDWKEGVYIVLNSDGTEGAGLHNTKPSFHINVNNTFNKTVGIYGKARTVNMAGRIIQNLYEQDGYKVINTGTSTKVVLLITRDALPPSFGSELRQNMKEQTYKM